MPLVVFQVDKFVEIVGSYLFTSILFLVRKLTVMEICHKFICIICTLLYTVGV